MALVPVFSGRPAPAVFVLAYPHPAVDKTTFTGFYTPGGYIPQNKGCRQHHKPFAGKNIAVYHPADSYHSSGNTTPHPRLFAYHNPAVCVKVPPQRTVYPGKTPGVNIAGNKRSGAYNRIYGKFFFVIFGSVGHLSTLKDWDGF
jgi:hypothetical protein